jgi:hypothetical protein
VSIGKASEPFEVCQWNSDGQSEKTHEKHHSRQSITALTFEPHTPQIQARNATATTAAATCLVTSAEPKYSYFCIFHTAECGHNQGATAGPRVQWLVYRCLPNVSVTHTLVLHLHKTPKVINSRRMANAGTDTAAPAGYCITANT